MLIHICAFNYTSLFREFYVMRVMKLSNDGHKITGVYLSNGSKYVIMFVGNCLIKSLCISWNGSIECTMLYSVSESG